MGRTVVSPPLTFNYTNQNENGVGDFPYYTPGINNNLQYTLKWRRLADSLGTGESIKAVNELFSYTTEGTSIGQFNPVVLKEMVLPNGKSYRFSYNSYGEMNRIEYPTGAVERFRYEALPPFSFSVGTQQIYYTQGNRGVVERWLSPDGNPSNEQHWQYSIPHDSFLRATAPYRVVTTAPDGTRSERYLYVGKEISNLDAPKLPSQLAGKTYEERFYGTDGTLLRRVLSEWNEANITGGGGGTGGGGCVILCMEGEGSGVVQESSSTIASSPSPYLASYPRLTRVTSIIFEKGSSQALAQSVVSKYDGYTNVKREIAYGFTVLDASVASTIGITNIQLGNALRTTENNYITDPHYLARQMVSLLTSTTQKVGDENGSIVGKVEVFYDETNYARITENTTLPSFATNSWVDPQADIDIPSGSKSTFGDITTKRSYYDIANNLYIETHAQADKFGNSRKAWDAKGNVSEIQYDQQFAFAYPTKIVTPIPATSVNPTTSLYHGSQTAFETNINYDFNTGVVLSTTDSNGQTTWFEFNDSLNRPTKMIRPQGGGQTLIEYGDVPGNLFVKAKTQIAENNYIERTEFLDGLGRSSRSRSKYLAGDILTETQYDQMGRVWKVATPYRDGGSVSWTITSYDDIGRVKEIITPDGAKFKTYYDIATTGTNIGTVITAEEQTGRKRRSISDAFGRIIRVDEPHASTGNLGSFDNPVQASYYSYTITGSLQTVTQGGQTRTYYYDAVGRLISINNPESGTISYSYDANNNLSTKTDARNITTMYYYDSLDRLISHTYRNCQEQSCTSEGTPDVNYFYDGTGVTQTVTNAKGRLTKVSSSASETRYMDFDATGQLISSQQVIDGQTYSMNYLYNLAGNLVAEIYPSGRVVTNSYNSCYATKWKKSKKK